MILTTTPFTEGQRFTSAKGIDSGDANLGASIFRDVFAAIRAIVAGRLATYEQDLLGAGETTAVREIDERAPKITLPAEVEAEVRSAYGAADVILEYGSGGSTVIASELSGKTVFSVENDQSWAEMMRQYLDQNPAKAKVNIHSVDIGQTKAWGHPVSRRNVKNWHEYPTSVWHRDDFAQPDVVLIDGRFRAACLLTVMMFTKTPVRVIFDDYIDRDQYKFVERFIEPVRFVARAALFDVVPVTPTPVMLTALMAATVKTA